MSVVLLNVAFIAFNPSDALGECAMQIIDPTRHPLMLARPIGFVLDIKIIKIYRDATTQAIGADPLRILRALQKRI